jgi:hypothetical protein
VRRDPGGAVGRLGWGRELFVFGDIFILDEIWMQG